MGGTLSARDLPATGCVFTLALPKLARAQIARTHSKLELATAS
jgi:hypothetical protein